MDSNKVTSTELKNRLGLYLDKIETAPLIITESGRDKAVLMSFKRYQELEKLEHWLKKEYGENING